MTKKIKQIIRMLAASHELRIKYVSDLPPKVPGFLDPSKASRTIVVNANKSKSDHVFTILHEIAHFILHFERSHRVRSPWYFTRQWKSKRVMRLAKLTSRVAWRKFNEEEQADAWAFCALFQLGATDDIQVILTQHPEKTGMFCLCAFSSICTAIKVRVRGVIRRVFQFFLFLMQSE
jgi:hypothetical protein